MSGGGRFAGWHEREKTDRRMIGALLFGGLVVILGFPLLFYLLSPLFDLLLRPFFGGWLDVLALIQRPWDLVFAMIVGLSGLAYGLWSVMAQWSIGKGTPIPSVPTSKLIVVGPYKYSRNPMTFGSILLYVGIAVFFHSLSMVIVIILVFMIPLLLYIKVVEEKELAARFGHEYLEYKMRTRFIVPLPKRQKSA